MVKFQKNLNLYLLASPKNPNIYLFSISLLFVTFLFFEKKLLFFVESKRETLNVTSKFLYRILTQYLLSGKRSPTIQNLFLFLKPIFFCFVFKLPRFYFYLIRVYITMVFNIGDTLLWPPQEFEIKGSFKMMWCVPEPSS